MRRQFAAAILAALLPTGASSAAVIASYSAEVSAGVTLTGAHFLGTGIAAYDALRLTGWDDDGDQYLYEDGFGRIDPAYNGSNDWEWSYDFPRLLCDREPLPGPPYAGQRRGTDREWVCRSGPCGSVIAPVFSHDLNGYQGFWPA